MMVIAEGVEYEEDLLTLIELGVGYGQGYLCGYPAPQCQLAKPRCVELCQIQQQRTAIRRNQIATTRVGDPCRVAAAVEPSTLCGSAERLFQNDEELMGIPVIQSGKPVGLVMRDKFYMRMASRYGYSLYENRPIYTIMDTQPLIVEFNDSLENVAQAATQREQVKLNDNIIVCVQESYFGILTARDMLESIMRQGVKFAQYANPLTGLPGNVMIQREIEWAITNPQTFTVLYVDLDNFKAYNDVYGFDRGDEVLKFTAALLQECFPLQPDIEPFIDHLGGDDFVVVVGQRVSEELLQHLLMRFNEQVCLYYADADRETGYIHAANRRGEIEQFPFISISIAVVDDRNGPLESYHDLAKRATEVKKICKTTPGSCVIYDRRSALSLTLAMERIIQDRRT